MQISSAQFIKSIVGPDELLEDGKSQIAFIGRSNVGKSSTINALTNQKGLARTSASPGRTQQLNIFLINRKFYLVDLPGYGFAKGSWESRNNIQQLIYWYLLDSPYKQKKIVLIIDAKVGPTADDLEMIFSLEKTQKDIIVIANKIDKIKKSEYHKQLSSIQTKIGAHKIIPFSAEKRIGLNELRNEISS